MSNLADWKLHGSVHTLRIEHAVWDPGKEDWQAPLNSTWVRFQTDGRISENGSQNPDGSVCRSSYSYDLAGRVSEVRSHSNDDEVSKAIYSYDDAGRLARIAGVGQDGIEREGETYRYSPEGKRTKIFVVPQMANTGILGYGIEGTGMSCSVRGAATIATAYDEEGRPEEIRFYDANNSLLQNVTLKRDAAGRLLRVHLNVGDQFTHPGMEAELAEMPPEAREMAAARLASLFGAFITDYTYDEKGRLLERCTGMGELGEDRNKYRYDDYDNEIEETVEHTSRELQIDDEGNLQHKSENVERRDVRFEYQYDAQGNWTERAVWSRIEPNPDFQRSNITRREITYYAT